MADISASNTGFALELLRTLSQASPAGNIFVSPLSISSALAMVYLGAKGDTAAQMAKVSTHSIMACFQSFVGCEGPLAQRCVCAQHEGCVSTQPKSDVN